MKILQWEPSCTIRMDARKDMTNLRVAFRKFVTSPENRMRAKILTFLYDSLFSPVQRTPTECGVSQCDREARKWGGPGPLGAVAPVEGGGGGGVGSDSLTVTTESLYPEMPTLISYTTNITTHIRYAVLFIKTTATDTATMRNFY
jgi:hypothetical protein